MVEFLKMNNPLNPNNTSIFIEEIHGIPSMRISSGGAHAAIAAQGAQVLSWVDPLGQERLYLSQQTMGLTSLRDKNAAGPAIRGGVPVCFPQFSDRGSLMKHGFARIRLWDHVKAKESSASNAKGPSAVLFRFGDDESTRSQWPHRFDAQLLAEVGAGSLQVRFEVQNTGEAPFSFTVALHTYLRVKDIRQVSLLGLQGVAFEDATKGMIKAVQQEEPLRIAEEIDRVYLNPPQKLALHEGDAQSLLIEQEGFTDTVVWNPGPEKASALADFPDDDWLRMLCVEAACAAKPVCLQPGERWAGSQVLTVPDMR
jgi:glucose-6-phosphate 1-epimerase